MFLTFGGRYNRYFCDTRLKMLILVNFNMPFQLVLTKFFKSKLFSCLPKVGHVIKSCKPHRKYTSCTLYDISICITKRPTWRLADQSTLSSFFKSNDSRTSKRSSIHRLPIWRHDSCGTLQDFFILLELTEKSLRKLMKVT